MSYENFPKFREFLGKNILCVDYGTKVTGLAYFCPGKEPFPIPHERIIYENDLALIEKLKEYIDEDFIDLVVLGIPYLLDGKETPMTLKIKSFGEKLKLSCNNIDVYFQDETLSTSAAKDRMLNSAQYNYKVDLKKIDQVAAVIILEDFIKS